MDEWFGIILFLFFFVVLPMLQGIAQRRKRQQGEEAEAEEPWDPEPTARPARRRIEPDDWLDGRVEQPSGEKKPVAERSAWEDLGLDDLFREPAEAPRPAPRPQAQPRPEQPRPASRPTPAPQPVPMPAPAPAPRAERPQPARRAERPQPVARKTPPPPVPRSTARERRDADRAAEHALFRLRGEPAKVRREKAHEILPDFHDQEQLRRSIVIAEVLGPPRALLEHQLRH
jgi:hypothetical protein